MNCKGFFTVIFLLDLYFFSPLEQLAAASSSSAAVTADGWRWWEDADEKDVIERKTIKKHKHKHTSIVEQILPDSSCLSLSFILNIEQKTSKCLIKRCFLFLPRSLVRPFVRCPSVPMLVVRVSNLEVEKRKLNFTFIKILTRSMMDEQTSAQTVSDRFESMRKENFASSSHRTGRWWWHHRRETNEFARDRCCWHLFLLFNIVTSFSSSNRSI